MFSLFLFLPFLVALALATPHAGPVHLPILRRAITPEQRIANLPKIMDAIRIKYGYKPVNQKRAVSASSITDEGNDSSYSAVVSVGTPALDFNLILDTGSSDLWVATNQCSACSGVPLFDPSKSSSFKGSSSTLQITYGSGAVAGFVSEDTVTFSGFTMNQELLSATDTTQGLLTNDLSGIMGLGFDTLSSLQTSPFWQTLMNQNMLSSPVFSFYLKRFVDQSAISAAPGGTFTLGGTNTSLYSGNIEFIDIPNGVTPSFWFQQVKTVTVQGKSISISSSESLAAIDTGTTLIGAPSDVARQFWSNVPGAVALSGQFQGMFAFPCGTSVSSAISFGGTTWTIDPADMNIGSVGGLGENQMCAGGIFDIGSTATSGPGNNPASGPAVPAWIVGDTFLKNVYTVFRGNPPAVGFARLANGQSSSSGSSSGSNPVTVTGSAGVPLPSGSGSSSGSTSAALPTKTLSMSINLGTALLSGLLTTVWCM